MAKREPFSSFRFIEVSGRSRGRQPLFLDQTDAQRAKKIFLRPPPPPPLSQGLDDCLPPGKYMEITKPYQSKHP